MITVKNVSAAICFVMLLFSLTAVALGGESPIRITEMAVTTKIVKGNPIDSVHRISSAVVKTLYCFTRIRSSAEGNTVIRHVWYRDDVKVSESVLPIRGKNWRTYSKKSIEKGWTGEWRVEALDGEGRLLKTVRFRMN